MAPAELENLVRSLDGVADCAVLGVPHPRAGQVPRAVVVKGRKNLTIDEREHQSTSTSREGSSLLIPYQGLQRERY